MLSCEFIVSESLHGLIIAEAYRIPNIYISFGPLAQDFKYEDFFLSIHKPAYKPYKITSTTTYNDLLKL
jgi:pyruvyltransferase